jgi:hypothetical protein
MLEIDQATLTRPSDHADFRHGLDELRKQRNDANPVHR